MVIYSFVVVMNVSVSDVVHDQSFDGGASYVVKYKISQSVEPSNKIKRHFVVCIRNLGFSVIDSSIEVGRVAIRFKLPKGETRCKLSLSRVKYEGKICLCGCNACFFQ